MSRLNFILSRHRTQSRTLILARTQYVYCVRDLAPDLVWQDLGDLLDPNYFQTLKAGGKERERERETSACIRISCNLEKYHVSVLKMILGDASRASAFARQSRIFDRIDALHAFYRMPKCLN